MGGIGRLSMWKRKGESETNCDLFFVVARLHLFLLLVRYIYIYGGFSFPVSITDPKPNDSIFA